LVRRGSRSFCFGCFTRLNGIAAAIQLDRFDARDSANAGALIIEHQLIVSCFCSLLTIGFSAAPAGVNFVATLKAMASRYYNTYGWQKHFKLVVDLPKVPSRRGCVLDNFPRN
jgi:hypothetical protein